MVSLKCHYLLVHSITSRTVVTKDGCHNSEPQSDIKDGCHNSEPQSDNKYGYHNSEPQSDSKDGCHNSEPQSDNKDDTQINTSLLRFLHHANDKKLKARQTVTEEHQTRSMHIPKRSSIHRLRNQI
ncbi:hypothetical protein AVEN_235752-1 [Araneus ventricosus]|uniref:Uncharacterized protein n=1 Tax=Araneus ventricosus TaxID=182803 RepID=A0A4Y2TH00_ARAVE|nr:hypothetical protein AVEN_235752-1 [Araneus ventricosus]